MTITEKAERAPRTAAARALASTTILEIPLLYGMYRSDLAQPGGPSPVMTLLVALPALPVFATQRVRNARPALLTALLIGLICCFAVAAVLGFNADWADYTGIAVGTLVFDLVFWSRSRGRSERAL